MSKTRGKFFVKLVAMKKVFFILLAAMFVFGGCHRADMQNYAEILGSELPLADTKGEIHFSTTLSHIPTVKYKIQNEEIFFVVDSASVSNWFLGTKAVRKVVPEDLYRASKIVHTTILTYFTDNLLFLLDPNYRYSAVLKNSPYDGFLGLAYLEQYKNVVFDYQNNTITFNQEPICDNELPLYKNQTQNMWYTTFECNGVSSNVLVDTGCFSVFVNKANVKSTVGEDEIINVRLGNVEINGISIAANKTLITNEDAKNGIYKNENILGYPCFKDHVIQLDFEHNKFRIK